MYRLCEWFKVDLPEYLFPATSDVDASIIDTDVIREVCEVCYNLQFSLYMFAFHCLHMICLSTKEPRDF